MQFYQNDTEDRTNAIDSSTILSEDNSNNQEINIPNCMFDDFSAPNDNVNNTEHSISNDNSSGEIETNVPTPRRSSRPRKPVIKLDL